MLSLLRERSVEVVKAVLPLVGVVSALQIVLVGAPLPLFLQFLAGATLAALGMLLLLAGIELGILPMGRFIGADLPRKGSVGLILAVVFALAFATTVAEPDVLVLADQVEAASQRAISGRALTYVIAGGVGTFAALAVLRVLVGFPMTILLVVTYALMIALSFAAPPAFVPLAYDAGSVTTGVLTAPVVLAVAIGLSSVLADRSAMSDGFGLLGYASIGPILLVLVMGAVLR